MLVSNTQTAAVVAKAFNQSEENVVGEDDKLDIAERIQRFGRLIFSRLPSSLQRLELLVSGP